MSQKIKPALWLLFAFFVGFSLWNYALHGLTFLVQQYQINSLWAVVLSRFALLGYMLPFVLWFCFEPQRIYGFHVGDMRAVIKMPFIWHGIRDNVARVCTVFSLSCLVLSGMFFYINQLSVSVLVAGVAFAFVNSMLEEFLWRGFILSQTIRIAEETLGLLVMSVAFGLYHYPLGFSLPVCLLFSLGGFYFGGVAIRSKGLILPTIMHISMNLLFVSVGMIF